MDALETDRLLLQPFTLDDAPFILELLNTPAWLTYIGYRGVHTLQDARQYLLQGPIYNYEHLGFGPYRVTLKNTELPIGMCGLFKREGLDEIDIGFAFLPDYIGKGYGYESARAVMTYARHELGATHIVGICDPANQPSIQLLQKLGLRYERTIRLPLISTDSLLFRASLLEE